MLQLKHISKSYTIADQTVAALKDVSVDFRQKEFVAILGPSGCGKTTLLNLIGGLDRYDEGDLIIEGRSTKEYSAHDWDTYRNHRIGFVFQSYNLIPHQTVLANVELALTLSGVSKSERRRRAKEALAMVGLGDQMHKKPNQMSGGQMQRVAIARALINDPDIILADEPTGALDSETSLQIMDILKSISSRKLIIMVTHNPELAQQYASRIVRLLDGKIVDDTAPVDDLPVPADQPTRRVKKEKGTSMSFFTALNLSLNNLMTKKTRTILTSFAGSIGIIGIALILSISSGISAYIDSVERETLTSYPIRIEEATMDLSSMMSTISGEKETVHEDGRVYSNNVMTGMIDSMLGGITTNNLAAFKSYLEEHTNDIGSYVSDIQYRYNTVMNIYKADMENGVYRVNPDQVLAEMTADMPGGGDTSGMTSMGNTANTWTELLADNDMLTSQYDILTGRLPENYDELVLIVDEDNEISDYALYALGLKDTAELRQAVADTAEGKPVELDKESVYTYDELMALTFKLLVNTDYFEKKDNVWIDQTDNDFYLSSLLESDRPITLKIVGILRAGDSVKTTGGIGYLSSLTDELINRVNQSEIVTAQKADPKTDVFNGYPFPDKSGNTFANVDELTAFLSKQSDEESQQGLAYVSQMRAMGKSDEEIVTVFNKLVADGQSKNTYEGNLLKMGVSDLQKPSAILLFPKDFNAKNEVSRIINEYNDAHEQEDKITYTDYIGLMLSGVTKAINAISYLLIAFVGISLVVSSIMIGIITYISVLERTKEIGILRAIGASKRDISRVFNAETVIIGLTAGVLGIGLTILLNLPINRIIEHYTDIADMAQLPTVGGVMLIGISVLLTFVAGLIPSVIAARKDPVIALRSE